MMSQNEKQCRLAAIKLLAARAYSENELRQKLQNKEYGEETCNSVINELVKRGYLNDTALCRILFTKYLESGKYGIHCITGKLKQRGLSGLVISAVAAEYDKPDEVSRAMEIIRRKFAKIEDAPRAKIGRFLAYRGFSSETIRKVLDNFMSASKNDNNIP